MLVESNAKQNIRITVRASKLGPITNRYFSSDVRPVK